MDIGGASSVIWDRIAASPSTTTWNQSGNNINFYFYQVNQTAVFRISAINGCGETTNDFGFKSVTCGGGGGGCNAVYTLSPNPTSGSIKITPQIPAPCNVVSTSSLASTATNKSGFVAVYDQQGTLKKQFHYSYNSELEIDLSNFKNGIYLIEIYDGNTIDKKTIILQH
jgi:hypothetical protein